MAEPVKFEKALERLEKIVEDLELGEVRLDEALKKYEEGVKLARTCQDELNQAEKKIEILSRSLEGTRIKEPFILEESADEASGRSKNSGGQGAGKNPPRAFSKTKKTSSEEKDDEDLLL